MEQLTIREEIKEMIKNNQDKKELFECAITYVKSLNESLSDLELKQFLMLCSIHNLNPLKREIYAIKYGNKFDIITNYNEYLKRSDATGLVEYCKVEVVENKDNPNFPSKAIFIAKRKDQTQEFRTECRFLEYTTGMSTWKTKPFFMLEKCAFAKGIRLLFPNELGNMPYVNEELWYKNTQNQEAIEQNIKQEYKAIEQEESELSLNGVLSNE